MTGFATPLLTFRKLLKHPNVSVGVANPEPARNKSEAFSLIDQLAQRRTLYEF